jgi:carbon monoxide dehydrogenase subunit G
MIVEEKFRVKTSIQEVWAFILDPEKIGSCIPGCEKIEIIGESTYESTIAVKLPIISIAVKSKTTVTEMDPPRHLRSVTEGTADIGAGTFQLDTVIDLSEIARGEVEVSYVADTRLGGGLVGFGEKIISAMAKGMAEQFAKNIREKLEKERS